MADNKNEKVEDLSVEKAYNDSASFIKERYNHMIKTRQINLDDEIKKSERRRLEKYNKEISEEETINYNKRLEILKTKRLELDEEMKEYEKTQKENRRRLFK